MGQIVGFSGKIGSGKTFCSKKVVELTEGLFEIKGFAHALKNVAALMTGLPVDHMYDQEKKNIYLNSFSMTLGEFLQYLGTEVGRTMYSNVWVDALMNTYDESQYWVIEDVRFKNEADAIREQGGILIRLEGDPSGVREKSDRDLTHKSETDLDDYSFDYVICTDKPKLETVKELDEILNKEEMVKCDSHRDIQILEKNFKEFFHNFMTVVIETEGDLNMTVGEALVKYMIYRENTDNSRMCYDLDTKSPRDIQLNLKSGKLQGITFQLKNQNR